MSGVRTMVCVSTSYKQHRRFSSHLSVSISNPMSLFPSFLNCSSNICDKSGQVVSTATSMYISLVH